MTARYRTPPEETRVAFRRHVASPAVPGEFGVSSALDALLETDGGAQFGQLALEGVPVAFELVRHQRDQRFRDRVDLPMQREVRTPLRILQERHQQERKDRG